MDRPLLNDRNEYPDDGVLAAHLGRAKSAWDAFAAGVAARFGDASLEWRYYNDGNAWLCKVVRKKKTVCWVSVWDRFFKTTFYFTAKSDRGIESLPIPSDVKRRVPRARVDWQVEAAHHRGENQEGARGRLRAREVQERIEVRAASTGTPSEVPNVQNAQMQDLTPRLSRPTLPNRK